MTGTRRGLPVAALATVLLAGCTTGSAEESAGTDAAEVSPSSVPPSPPSTEPAPHADRARQPVVLVSRVTEPLTFTRGQARAVLRGRGPTARVVAAPGLADSGEVSDRVSVLPSARAVRVAVEQGRSTIGILEASQVTPTVRAARVGGVDPLASPRTYPLLTDGPRPPRPTSLTVVGDLMLTRGVADPAAALRPMAARLRSADLTVGNLESTLSRAGVPQQGSDSFGADPGILAPLRRAGFDALSLANNHTGDYEDAALIETVQRLRRSPIAPFGAGRDLGDAGRAAVMATHGTTFGFLGFNAIGETPEAAPGTPGALSVSMPPRTGPLDARELARTAGLVSRLAARVDVVVVLPHWGTQYTHAPEPVQRTVARRLVDAGADLVVGGHPHWVQGLDAYRGAVVAHSLGNFVFDMDFMTETQQGVVLEATFWGSRLKAVHLVPYRMDSRFAPRPAGPAEARDILGDVWETSTGPFRAR